MPIPDKQMLLLLLKTMKEKGYTPKWEGNRCNLLRPDGSTAIEVTPTHESPIGELKAIIKTVWVSN